MRVAYSSAASAILIPPLAGLRLPPQSRLVSGILLTAGKRIPLKSGISARPRTRLSAEASCEGGSPTPTPDLAFDVIPGPDPESSLVCLPAEALAKDGHREPSSVGSDSGFFKGV